MNARELIEKWEREADEHDRDPIQTEESAAAARQKRKDAAELRDALPEHESESRELLREAWHQLADARLSANLYGEELERVKDEVHLRVLQNEEEQDRWKETEDRIRKHLEGESDAE